MATIKGEFLPRRCVSSDVFKMVASSLAPREVGIRRFAERQVGQPGDLQFGRPGRHAKCGWPSPRLPCCFGCAFVRCGRRSRRRPSGRRLRRAAFIGEAKASGDSTASPANDMSPALGEIPLHQRSRRAAERIGLAHPAPIVNARLPHPRPDVPLYTGSIDAAPERTASAAAPLPQRARHVDPGEVLRSLGATLALPFAAAASTRRTRRRRPSC